MKTYRLTKLLYKKSITAFLLSLELYNKPTIDYRTEAFCILFINAWELLFKAYIFQASNGKRLSVFRRKKKNKERESISLDECMNKIFSNNNDPVKKNIEYIAALRNEAAHLVIPALDPYFSRVFQAGITNYATYIYQVFSIDINKMINPGLVSLISDRDKLPDIQVIRARYSKEDFESILGWIERFDELSKLGETATLSIKHKVAIVKNPKKADFIISSGNTSNKEAIIVEKTKDPDTTHPFNRKNALLEISRRLQQNKGPSTYDFDAFVWDRGYKKHGNDEYYYKGHYSGAGQYSNKFIDEFVSSLQSDNKAISKSKVRYKEYLSRKQKKDQELR